MTSRKVCLDVLFNIISYEYFIIYVDKVIAPQRTDAQFSDDTLLQGVALYSERPVC